MKTRNQTRLEMTSISQRKGSNLLTQTQSAFPSLAFTISPLSSCTPTILWICLILVPASRAFSCRNISVRGTRLPEKGPTTGSIIGGIIGAILVLALIGTVIAVYRKRCNGKLGGDGPPKYKPPPPKKKNTTPANKELNANLASAPEIALLNNQDYSAVSAEPVTDLDAHNDEDNYGAESAHYYAAAHSGWDDPADSEVPPPYVQTDSNHQDHQGPAVDRGDSFVSPAMFV